MIYVPLPLSLTSNCQTSVGVIGSCQCTITFHTNPRHNFWTILNYLSQTVVGHNLWLPAKCNLANCAKWSALANPITTNAHSTLIIVQFCPHTRTHISYCWLEWDCDAKHFTIKFRFDHAASLFISIIF